VKNLYSWNELKNEINKIKHGVSFEEAKEVFDDDYAVYEVDDEHSGYEERMTIIGKSKNQKLLFVCHCCREKDKSIRIISARKADKKEETIYYTGGVL
jgi:hypothetical protein